MIVADVQALLDARYPPQDAEPWDRVGLLSGEASRPVTHIACALDPDLETIRRASQCGADLLVTHHPTWLAREPDEAPSMYGLTLEYAARESGIALIACHTNLDVSEEARLSLGNGLNLKSEGTLADWFEGEETPFEQPDFAQLWSTKRKTTLEHIADRLSRLYRTPVRLTIRCGGPDHLIFSIVTATGSGGDVIEAACARHADLLITGELKYHQLLEARDLGLSVIELGHDVSEWPLAALLFDALKPACEASDVRITLLKRVLQSDVRDRRKNRP
ncbi:MAG: Nif3-like dinuclear metal center hexameric protein [Actinomycetia bacterium]|nr:Nif3-like dinuclear metal center hexameric protein [Actinomycetes bacterium]